ncbi:hypothetical protein XBKB1_1080012 [Xenorhabdus bovienii str. kraussei Becker Underwood]|uniref:Uncharacterized protein n=1 Tax=Xenorhabdus bovienii str. kraussei Becker Underwood TaxID=1398204 RepID=A0A077PQY7_XENBV|nr:hypothetical protein XBKB1_1080012 [Xenorhabdus bovienii str. kraussei Becker Underwood]
MVFSLSHLKMFNFNTNSKGYGDCLFYENKKTDNIKEFSLWLNYFVKITKNERFFKKINGTGSALRIHIPYQKVGRKIWNLFNLLR